MAWKQVSGCVTPSEENSSATDGDMDIAYALLFADAQWGSTGTINYRQEALNVMQAIMAQDINPNTWSIMLGDWVEPAEPVYYYGTRTSDFMLNHLRAYQTMSGDARWGQVLTTTYNLIHAMQTTYSPNTGLLPDFIQNLNSTPQPAASSYLEGPYDGQYNYNACRDPCASESSIFCQQIPAQRPPPMPSIPGSGTKPGTILLPFMPDTT
jgi:endo-1,4-beta-D-glucanase Y